MPQYITDFQRELLLLMKDCLTATEVAVVFPAAQRLYELRVTELRSLSVSWRQLLLRRTASHAIEDYQVLNGTSLSMRSLHAAGIEVAPGEKVRYLVVQQHHRDASRRYMAEEIAELRGSEFLPYDAAYYVQQLFEAFHEIFAPFVSDKILSPAESLQPGIFGINPNS